MYNFILFVHIFVSVILIVIVLLQKGRGTDISSIFGGGGQNPLMGSRGAADFIGKLTIFCAVMFMMTSLYLSINSGKRYNSSVLEKAVTEEADKLKMMPPPSPMIQDTSVSVNAAQVETAK